MLEGRFELLRMLGAGGMGVVWEALDRERGTRVALKTLREPDTALLVRLKHEFRALADVSHPNLVALHELWAQGEQAFFTMELVDGLPLLDWLGDAAEPAVADADTARTVRVTPVQGQAQVVVQLRAATCANLTKLRPALRQLAEGVAALHEAGMLHRDLKPSNVLVTRDGRVVLLDFGLARPLGERTDDVELAGTIDYMSPEQAARAPLGPPSDWYSLGVVLYRTLTGRLPFSGGSADVLIDKQVRDPLPPRALVQDVPADLDALACALLQRDPVARPSAREVLRALGSPLRTLPPRPGSTSGNTAFIGRAGELAALDDALARAAAGQPVVLVVGGPSGNGKSALLSEWVLRQGMQQDGVVLAGRCFEREQVPYKALDSLLDALAGHLLRLDRLEAEGLVPRDTAALVRVFPVLRQVEAIAAAPRRNAEAPDPGEVRRRAFGALRELFARMADRRPLALVLDDVQWGDLDSAAVIGALLRPPDAPAVLLVLGCRDLDESPGEFLPGVEAHLERAGVAPERLRLGPLPADEAARVVRALLGSGGSDPAPDVGRLVARIVDEAAGSPFSLQQLGRHVRDETGEVDLASLEDIVQRRIDRLPGHARRLLEVVALAGRPIAQRIAERAAEVGDPTGVAILRAAGLVRASGGEAELECAHDRIRESTLGGLDEGTQRRLHRRIALVLETTPVPDPEAMAIHLRGAGDAVRAADWALRAADRAATALAFERAARLYRLVLELDSADPGRTQEVRVRLANALADAGRGREAASAYLAAEPGANAAQALDLRRRAAEALLRAGHIAEGFALAREVCAAVGMKIATTPRSALLSLLWRRAGLRLRGLKFSERDASQVPPDELTRIDVGYAMTTGFSMVDAIRSADFQAQLLSRALDAGEPSRVLRALAVEMCFRSLRGPQSAAAVDAVRVTAQRLAEQLGSPEGLAALTLAEGVVAHQYGRFRASLEACRRAEEIFRDRCTGRSWEIGTAQLFGLYSQSLLGELRELRARLETLVAEATDRGDLHARTNLEVTIGHLHWLSIDDPARGRRELAEALERWSIPDARHIQHFNALAAVCNIDLYEGRGAEALARIDARLPDFERAMLLRVQAVFASAMFTRARAAVATGGAALARARKDAARLVRSGTPYGIGFGRLIEAAIPLRTGDTELAASRLDVAARALDAGEQHLWAVAARYRRGELLGGTEGAALVADGETFFRREGVRAVVPFVRMLGV